MDQNSRFLLKAFRKYYKGNVPILPSRFTRREFGFMFFDKNFVQRHIGFSSQTDLQIFMIGQVPSHSYYSTAYYRRPDAPTMDEKEWLGADLIFDLDADHLVGADKMTYSEMLEQIRKEMINLVDSFLFGDLGFKEDQVEIVFSGGRGYHAHIELPNVSRLGTHERREIVDYVTGTGLDIERIFPTENDKGSTIIVNGKEMNSTVKWYGIPSENSGGWRLRMREGLKDVVFDLCELDEGEFKKKYPSVKASKSIPKYRESVLPFRDVMFANNRMRGIDKNAQNMLVKIMKEDMAFRMSGEVDEPVTADIKRLIRLPGSVHGKSGLKVVPLTRDQLTDFDPLSMAVPKEYSEDDVTVTMRKKTSITIREQEFRNLEGTIKIPEYAAVFLVGRKMADIGDGSAPRDSFF